MYVILQEDSPLGFKKNFTLTEVDMKGRKPMTVDQFYHDHVS
jgi:hypothetical protein